MRIRLIIATLLLLLVGCNKAAEVELNATLPESGENGARTDTPVPTQEPTSTLTLTTEPTLPATQTPTVPPDVQVISYQISEVDGMGMVLVPAGEFMMGSVDGWESEQPVHTVNLPQFWIDQTEVTNKQYQLCVEAGTCDVPGRLDSFTRHEYYSSDAFADYPVINVSWYDAANYCQWVGRRLPTEAEWEKSARGVDERIYPWGENISCDYANYISCEGDTAPVGSYPLGASPYGVLDMAGNVWEWVSDWYYIGYYEKSPLDYPLGPESGAYRVVRGGSWNDYEWYLRTTARYSYFPDNERVSIGFRCVFASSE